MKLVGRFCELSIEENFISIKYAWSSTEHTWSALHIMGDGHTLYSDSFVFRMFLDNNLRCPNLWRFEKFTSEFGVEIEFTPGSPGICAYQCRIPICEVLAHIGYNLVDLFSINSLVRKLASIYFRKEVSR